MLIVLSVVLGFVVTEWRQASANEALAQKAQRSILTEIADNYRRVQQARRYHETMEDTLRTVDDTEVATGIVMKGFQGQSGIINPATVQTAAWDMAQSTGALRHMKWENVNTLAQAYTRQQFYTRHVDWFGRTLFDTAADRGPEGLMEATPGFFVVVSQFASQERQLLRRYRTALRYFRRAVPSTTAR